MNILAISGSLRAGSLNTMLIEATAALAPEGLRVTVYDGMGRLPHFGSVHDETAPDAIHELRALLASSDGVLICTPEYAHGMPGSLKNLLDWTVSSGDFDKKPTAVLSASPSAMGGDKAHASLTQTIRVLGAAIPDGASLIVPFVGKKFDADGGLIDEATKEALRSVLAVLMLAIKKTGNRQTGE